MWINHNCSLIITIVSENIDLAKRGFNRQDSHDHKGSYGHKPTVTIIRRQLRSCFLVCFLQLRSLQRSSYDYFAGK